ncbi:unnamed protein product [Lactuca virosa]|uniref:Uncharacterized protein n=1 Tax=Lactuca virosa TaxID=75947 RepID=A0AAU9LSH1_9ASTR|nr:unnamed protein product [Lactuca virosa]
MDIKVDDSMERKAFLYKEPLQPLTSFLHSSCRYRLRPPSTTEWLLSPAITKTDGKPRKGVASVEDRRRSGFVVAVIRDSPTVAITVKAGNHRDMFIVAIPTVVEVEDQPMTSFQPEPSPPPFFYNYIAAYCLAIETSL